MALYRHVDVSDSGDVTIVRLLDSEIRGETASNDLEPELTQLVSPDRHKKVLLDLSPVEFITSSAIVQLIMLKNSLNGVGGRLMLCSLRPEVYAVFTMMKLDTLFQIEADCAAGVDAFSRPEPAPESEADESSSEVDLTPTDDAQYGSSLADASGEATAPVELD